MRLLKPILLAVVGLFASVGLAQIPVPQINLTGNIGCQGFPCVNNGTLVFTTDANRAMTTQETSAFYIKVTSSVSLTATRNLTAPVGRFPFTIENATTGGQAIQIVGTSGAGVTIANGATVAVWNDGVNYVQVGVSSGGSGLNQLTQDVTAGPGAGSQAATVTGLKTVPFCTGFTPTNGQAIVYTTGGTPNPCYNAVTPSGGVTSFGPSGSPRTGAVVTASGDYTVSQVTGAAPLASPTFTGVPAAPTAAPGTNTTQLATTAFVLANGGTGAANFPTTGAPGVVYVAGNSATTSTVATSPQLVTGLNASPSSTLAPALLPLATTSAFGAVKCDGTTITCTAGVIASVASAVTLAGDVTGPSGSNTVVKINGGAPPVSTAVAGYNSGGQPVIVPSQTASYFFAAPFAAPGNPLFRPIVGADITNALGYAPGLPNVATLFFDYKMPASDSANAFFIDYSASDGSTVGVGNCPFLSGAAPTYLAVTGGASFSNLSTGGANGCTIPSGANSLRTFVALIQPNVLYNGNTFPFAAALAGGTATPSPILDLKPGSVASGGEAYGMGILYNGNTQTASQDSTSGVSCVAYTLGSSGDSTVDAFYLNGLPVGSYVGSQGQSAGLQTSGNYLLGSSGVPSLAYFSGNMYRALGWSGYLNAGAVAQACMALRNDAAVRGIANPLTTPNTSTTPPLSCGGDSIMYGVGSTAGNQGQCYSGNLTGTTLTYTTSINALGGSYIADEAGQAVAKEIAQCSTAAENIAIQEAGTNNLFGGESASDTWNEMKRYVQVVRTGWSARGCHGRIGVQTLTSRNSIDTGNAGYITAFTLTSGGSGYTSVPTVTFTGGGCTTAPTGSVGVSGGVVINPTINTLGLGCTSAPTPTFSGGGGTGAAGTSTLSAAGNGLRDPYNTLVRTQWAGAGFDFVNDISASTIMGCNFCFITSGTTYFNGDFTHPKDAGYAIMGAITSSNLNKVAALNQVATTTTSATYTQPTSVINLQIDATSNNVAVAMSSCVGSLFTQTYTRIDNTSNTVTLTAFSGDVIILPGSVTTTSISLTKGQYATLVPVPNPQALAGCTWTASVSNSGSGGGSATIVQVNGTPTTTATPVNLRNGTGNGGVAVTNPSVGNVDFNLSKAFGSGTNFTTGVASNTANELAYFPGTDGRVADSTILITDVMQLGNTQTVTGTKTFSAANAYGTPASIVLTNATGNATGLNAGTATNLLTCADTSASGTAQSCTTSPSFTPAANSCVIYTTTTANTGTGLTLNVNALGPKSVAKWLGTTTLAASDVKATSPQLACYNGTVWNLSTIGNAPSGGGFTNPMTTLGDGIYGGASGTATRLAGATAGAGTYVWAEQPSSTTAVAPTFLNLATYLASPPTIGGTAPGAINGTTGVFGTSLIAGSTSNTTGYTNLLNGSTAEQGQLLVSNFNNGGSSTGILFQNSAASNGSGQSIQFQANDAGFSLRTQALWSVFTTTNTGGALTADTTWQTMNAGTLAETMRLTGPGTLQVRHLAGNSSAPTIAAGTGAGTSPTVALVSATDLSGYITVTTGTAPVLSATIATVTFNVPYASAPKCHVTPSNVITQALTGIAGAQVFRANTTTTVFVLTQGATALTGSTAYEWEYLCTQ